jgi:hypothetical protein
MADLDRAELHKFLAARAKNGAKVTLREVMDHFGATEGATAKCLSLLTGNRALIETRKNEFDCSRVPTLTLLEFESAASQGKTNTAYVDGLWHTIARLRRDNETMREKLLAAQARIKELEAT